MTFVRYISQVIKHTSTKFVSTIKKDDYGNLTKYKACLVAREHT